MGYLKRGFYRINRQGVNRNAQYYYQQDIYSAIAPFLRARSPHGLFYVHWQ
jgi:hypothetical protein